MATVIDINGPYGDFAFGERVLVTGVSLSGKTYWADRLQARARRRVFVTPMPRDYDKPGRVRTTPRELLAEPALLRGSDVCVVVHLMGDTEEELAAEVSSIIKLCRKVAADPDDARVRGLGWGGLILTLDEVGDYKDACIDDLSKLARNGRHHNLVSVFVSQSAIDFPKSVRRQATRWVSMVQTDPDDLDACRKRCGEDFAAKVASWQPGDPPVTWMLPTLRHGAGRINAVTQAR